jgi:hypothetical protein
MVNILAKVAARFITIRFSWPTIVNTCSCKITIFHRLHSPSNETTSQRLEACSSFPSARGKLGHRLYSSLTLSIERNYISKTRSMFKFSIGSWQIGTSVIYISVHDFVQGYVRRYIF